MAVQQDLAVSTAPRIATAPWLRLAAGFALCVAIAAAAIAAADYAPIIGAPVIAIAIGVIVTNTLRGPLHIGTLRVGEVSKLCLKGGIILLGASLDLGVILRTGAESLPVLLLTIGVGLVCALFDRSSDERALADAMPDRDRHNDMRRVGDCGVGACGARQGGRDRLFDLGHFLFQHARGLHLSDNRPSAGPERSWLRPVGRHSCQ